MQSSNPLDDGGHAPTLGAGGMIGGSMLLSTSKMPGDDDDDEDDDLMILRAAAEKKEKEEKLKQQQQQAPEDLPEVAGERGLQSTVNPAPLDIVASKVLLRKDSGIDSGECHDRHHQSGLSKRDEQWGSVVNKPMKAREQFYDGVEGGASGNSRAAGLPPRHPSTTSPQKTHLTLAGIATEESITVNNTSPGREAQRTKSPTSLLTTESGGSAGAGGLGISQSGLTNASTTAPSSTNSLLPQRGNSGVVTITETPATPKQPK